MTGNRFLRLALLRGLVIDNLDDENTTLVEAACEEFLNTMSVPLPPRGDDA